MNDRCCQSLLSNGPQDHLQRSDLGAPGGIRTPNLLIRSQMLYPLSYRRLFSCAIRRPRPSPSDLTYRSPGERTGPAPGKVPGNQRGSGGI